MGSPSYAILGDKYGEKIACALGESIHIYTYKFRGGIKYCN